MRVATVFAAISLLSSATAALAQPARVRVLVSRPGEGRDIASTNDAVREPAERALARCEPAARAARPIDEVYFTLEVDVRGRIVRVRAPSPAPEYLDAEAGARLTTSRTLRARARAWISCAGRVLRSLRFPPGPAGPIEVMVGWQSAGPPQGVIGVMTDW